MKNEHSEEKEYYLRGLNKAQKEAVLHTSGPLLILAGAGAGKTKTITHRILHLIKNGVLPEKILAITFTNKSAKEMKDRVLKLLKNETQLNLPTTRETAPFMSTFHSLGVYIIREESEKLGLPRSFTIYDREDSRQVVKEAIIDSNLDPKQYDPGKILGIISKAKGEGKTPEEFANESEKSYIHEIVSEVFEKYENILKKNKALDFDDLLLKTRNLLKIEEIRKKYQNKWEHINIDEYQDTNKVQYDIAKLLAGEKQNIVVVGDIDQSIYSWRGADFKNMMRFENDFKGTTTIILEENYRSTKNIIKVANDAIEKNIFRKEKVLFTNNEEGDLLTLYSAFDERDEADFVARTIKMLIGQGVNPEEIAVLYRANFQSRIIEEALLKKQIQYTVIGTKFFERKEIKDTLSYLRVALNEASIADLKRAIGTPTRGIGKVTFAKIAEGKHEELRGAQKEKYDEFLSLLAGIKLKIKESKVSEVLKYTITNSGMEMMYKKGGKEEIERLENLKELVSIATSFDNFPREEGMEKFLEHASLASDQDEIKEEEKQGVKLLTVHASKGLEFEYVFITGLEDKLFPHQREEDDGFTREDKEEERRLFYVALTRAKKKLYLSMTHSRMIYGNREIRIPSEFVTEINKERIIRENGSGKEKFIYLE